MKRLFLAASLLCAFAILSACTAHERISGIVEVHQRPDNAPEMVYIQNQYLRLEFLTETAEIILHDRITGDYWRSTPEGAADMRVPQETVAIERFNKQSMFVLEFENIFGVGQPYDAYRFSVRNETFDWSVEDDVLELYFTVGDIVRTFIIPDAIYSERLYYFIEDMPRSERMQILNVYSPISIATMRAGDDVSALRSQFPTLDDGKTIYVLNDNIREFMLERVETSLAEAGYTREDWISDNTHFNVATELEQAAFNILMRFELVDNEMVLTIPMREINYIPAFKPTELVVLPYFVAGRATDEGYLFVPDGSGAIMLFGSGRINQGHYFNRMFGWDEAIVRDVLIHDNRAPYPVFGAYRNGATITAIIQDGAAYSSIRAFTAHMPGLYSPYSRVHPLFRLIHGTSLDVAGRTNDTLIMHEWALPDEDIVIRYVVTPGDGYVGMAQVFREFLQARYPWLNNRVEEPVHAMVEFLGGALTAQHILGFPVDRPYPLTTYNQAADMMQVLHDFGWRGLHVKMRGAHNDSIDHSVPTSFNTIRQLGGRSGFDNMVNTATRLGFEFYVEADFVRMRNDEAFDGFRPMRDAARQANRERVEHSGFSSVYFGALGTGSWLADPIILASPSFTINTARNFVDQLAGRGVNNIAFRCLASVLSGDFCEDNHVTREAAIHMRTDLLSELRDGGTGIWLNYGFSFAVPYADVITNIPLSDQGFGITDMAVPFYQIALHGLVPFAGRPLNLAEDHSYHLLKSIESGASLFFSFMEVATADLEVTRYRRYFANEFGRWQDIANDVFQRHVANMGHLYNQLITDHQILSLDGVTVTVYEDGTRVYVNTSLADFTAPTGVFIPARNPYDASVIPWVVTR